jgi:hypothetical protein
VFAYQGVMQIDVEMQAGCGSRSLEEPRIRASFELSFRVSWGSKKLEVYIAQRNAQVLRSRLGVRRKRQNSEVVADVVDRKDVGIRLITILADGAPPRRNRSVGGRDRLARRIREYTAISVVISLNCSRSTTSQFSARLGLAGPVDAEISVRKPQLLGVQRIRDLHRPFTVAKEDGRAGTARPRILPFGTVARPAKNFWRRGRVWISLHFDQFRH